MDAIRAAIGVPQISYVGFSYGTFLGATYADMYPDARAGDGPRRRHRPRAARTPTRRSTRPRASKPISTRSSRTAPARATARSRTDPTQRRRTTIWPAPSRRNRSRESSTGSSARSGPGSSTSASRARSYSGADGYKSLASALAAGRARRRGPDARAQRRVHRPAPQREVLERDRRVLRDGLHRRARPADGDRGRRAGRPGRTRSRPHFGASTVWLGLPCTYWPVAAEAAAAPIHAPGAPPIVVVGALHDPATPYAWAQSLAKELQSGRLLTASGNSHTSYGRGDQCVDGTVDAYLLKLQPPAAGAQCG